MEQWLAIIQEVGFPIVVTFYLLHRIETKLDCVIDAIQMKPLNRNEEPYQTKKTV
ncbi:YvrJ family protein [Fredinandcohnia quinoae]|uniref:YvrJ family protein n=1 Tax=Fredinandcohnia quinoae TaxID=2918902 RepID=A0AAW5DYP3_9BACI|nr:YvrJ family protein [Fredinandcohnia sp. SECRCQ15]MCH1625198.1 YvrJ family protein [Fredinandcohnia sp. SECRCQ15]